jgi:hypothetical protein
VDALTVPPAQVRPEPAGHWAYTQQYGWVWMPYDSLYTFTPHYETGDPYMYVYYPRVGWTWVEAPWLWGWGPKPHIRVGLGVNYTWYGLDWGPHWKGWRPTRYRNHKKRRR